MKPNRYTGVSYNKKEQKWRATISVNGKLKHIGSYLSEIEAYNARQAWVLENNFEPVVKLYDSQTKEYKEEWRKQNKERIKEYNAKYRKQTKAVSYIKEREVRRSLKQEVIEAYGGCCAECKESTFELLTIDHIDGKGVDHRKTIGAAGTNTYRWLKRNGFPKDNFQLLCWNCNCSKYFYGSSAKSSKH